MAGVDRCRCNAVETAMQLELSNFQPLAATDAVEQELQDLGGVAGLGADDRKKSLVLLRSYAPSQ